MAFSNGPPPDFIYINFKESTVGAERGGAHFIQFLPFVDEELEQQLAAQVTRLCSSQPRPEPVLNSLHYWLVLPFLFLFDDDFRKI